MSADLLGEILAAFKFKEFNIADFRLGAPWAISTEGFDPGFNLIVVEGRCWVRLPEGEEVLLQEGQSILLPKGGVITYGSGLDLRPASLPQVWGAERMQELSDNPATFHDQSWGGEGEACRLLGFAFELEETAEEQILPHLPAAMVIDNADAALRLVRSLRAFFATSEGLEPGEFATRARFAEGMVIDQLRRFILSVDHEAGWLAGIGHPKLQQAMALIHMQFDQPWSIEALAKDCGMSRASFAKHFIDVIGQPPITYLNDYRVRKARKLLITTALPLSEIAHRVGFGTEIALRRNMRRLLGRTPREVRRYG